MIPVAVYCRVSTDRDDQLNSFAAQQRYFRQYIEEHPDWQLYEIYADEGITGTSTRTEVSSAESQSAAVVVAALGNYTFVNYLVDYSPPTYTYDSSGRLSNTAFTVTPDEFHTLGRATPYAGQTLYGRCVLTVADGIEVYKPE